MRIPLQIATTNYNNVNYKLIFAFLNFDGHKADIRRKTDIWHMLPYVNYGWAMIFRELYKQIALYRRIIVLTK